MLTLQLAYCGALLRFAGIYTCGQNEAPPHLAVLAEWILRLQLCG